MESTDEPAARSDTSSSAQTQASSETTSTSTGSASSAAPSTPLTASTPLPTSTPSAEPSSGVSGWLWLVLGLLVVAAGVTIFVLVRRSRAGRHTG